MSGARADKLKTNLKATRNAQVDPTVNTHNSIAKKEKSNEMLCITLLRWNARATSRATNLRTGQVFEFGICAARSRKSIKTRRGWEITGKVEEPKKNPSVFRRDIYLSLRIQTRDGERIDGLENCDSGSVAVKRDERNFWLKFSSDWLEEIRRGLLVSSENRFRLARFSLRDLDPILLSLRLSARKTIIWLSWISLALKAPMNLTKAEEDTIALSRLHKHARLIGAACRSGRARYTKTERDNEQPGRIVDSDAAKTHPQASGRRVETWLRPASGIRDGMGLNRAACTTTLPDSAGHAIIAVRRTDDAHHLLVQRADNNIEARMILELGPSCSCVLESIPTHTFASPFASTAPSSPPSSPSSPSPNFTVGPHSRQSSCRASTAAAATFRVREGEDTRATYPTPSTTPAIGFGRSGVRVRRCEELKYLSRKCYHCNSCARWRSCSVTLRPRLAQSPRASMVMRRITRSTPGIPCPSVAATPPAATRIRRAAPPRVQAPTAASEDAAVGAVRKLKTFLAPALCSVPKPRRRPRAPRLRPLRGFYDHLRRQPLTPRSNTRSARARTLLVVPPYATQQEVFSVVPAQFSTTTHAQHSYIWDECRVCAPTPSPPRAPPPPPPRPSYPLPRNHVLHVPILIVLTFSGAAAPFIHQCPLDSDQPLSLRERASGAEELKRAAVLHARAGGRCFRILRVLLSTFIVPMHVHEHLPNAAAILPLPFGAFALMVCNPATTSVFAPGQATAAAVLFSASSVFSSPLSPTFDTAGSFPPLSELDLLPPFAAVRTRRRPQAQDLSCPPSASFDEGPTSYLLPSCLPNEDEIFLGQCAAPNRIGATSLFRGRRSSAHHWSADAGCVRAQI
ncbi:hypothetical protein C8R45DRAFT_1157192 [Mycena sanguinolenta]|nr:hypothetical protein C8R45DRAFT_1157192 [Mycena sanguinolenta]